MSEQPTKVRLVSGTVDRFNVMCKRDLGNALNTLLNDTRNRFSKSFPWSQSAKGQRQNPFMNTVCKQESPPA